MKAVIMAGGKGTRLSSVLSDIPKPMVSFAGKPLLEYQVENLKDSGITDIIMVIGYLGNVIKSYFGNGEGFGVHIDYFEETSPLGTAGGLYYLKDKLNEDFILLFGDLFINIDFQRFYSFHKEKQAEVTLYSHPNSHPYDSDIIAADETDKVIEWSYKNTPRTHDYKNLVNAGAYIISPSILGKIPEAQKTDLEKDIIVPSLKDGKIYAYRCTEYVKDIGTPQRLKKVEDDYLHGICAKRNLKNKQKCVFLDRDGTINIHKGFLRKAEDMELESTAAEAIRLINGSEYLAIVVSNQPVVARGECTFDGLENINARMYTLLGAEGAYVDDLYFCPHHPDSGFDGEVKELKINCSCRKPKIGMIELAAKEHNIDISRSWMIGDTTLDIQTGKNAGMKTALLLTGEAGKDGKYPAEPDIIQDDLLSCIKYILTMEENKNERTDQSVF